MREDLISPFLLLVCVHCTKGEQFPFAVCNNNHPSPILAEREGVFILASSDFADSPAAAQATLAPRMRVLQKANRRMLTDGDIPKAVADTVSRASRIVLAQVHITEGRASDLCDMILSALDATEPDKVHPIGLIYENPPALTRGVPYESWRKDMSLQDVRVCIDVRRVLLIEFIQKVSEELGLEVGIDYYGRLFCGRGDMWPETDVALYLLVFEAPEPEISPNP
ncbi:MAG: hypothetical protein K9N49_02550 [Candidatus Marinimicrobia bacterium]|nr:hypothetical protein [Candidatus Neomarinimicrobiota bacterium]